MLTGNNVVAFFIGLAGSVHCVGMCGPLAFGIPSAKNGWWFAIADKLSYNFGRVISYTALGFILGYAGRLAWLAGMQQTLSIVSGVVVVTAGLSKLFHSRRFVFGFDITAPFYKLIGIAIKHRAGHLLLGMINGLLPCGFVYIALFGALNTTRPLDAGIFMFWFGLGTIPLMVTAALSVKAFSPAMRLRINKTMPYLTILLGAWFILRGANLDIPYLSPLVKAVGVSICH
ncbi:sulfite exporter TauE/SafE family protein [Mucilaginibacter conchicola]|uniref:Sulfite exporter TauE/SafE family protein n=1 Tax=Mucilaginibacter conchicola TaxID=2303333 RepID=A0A372NLV9_9SPHI|nr:sulfite exporter TauE/SafE family protein [Mucilaginibacter conchicola]RFZ89946.1 sulfite exporter TauE/SafE family protein [Mucilaginibacter conchicola]